MSGCICTRHNDYLTFLSRASVSDFFISRPFGDTTFGGRGFRGTPLSSTLYICVCSANHVKTAHHVGGKSNVRSCLYSHPFVHVLLGPLASKRDLSAAQEVGAITHAKLDQCATHLFQRLRTSLLVLPYPTFAQCFRYELNVLSSLGVR